jgi:hypothetical protein
MNVVRALIICLVVALLAAAGGGVGARPVGGITLPSTIRMPAWFWEWAGSRAGRRP